MQRVYDRSVAIEQRGQQNRAAAARKPLGGLCAAGSLPLRGPHEWCSLSVETDEQWKALLQTMGAEEWGSNSRFSDVAGRMRHHDEIDRRIEAWTQPLANAEVERRLKAVGVPSARMRRINDVIESEGAATVFAKMEEPRVGTMLTTRLPFSFDFNSLPPPRNAPSLGENTAEVLREWLNLSNDEIAAIRNQETLL